MKKLNMYFFGVEKITLEDGLYFYGILGGAIVLTTTVAAITW